MKCFWWSITVDVAHVCLKHTQGRSGNRVSVTCSQLLTFQVIGPWDDGTGTGSV